MTDYDRHNIVSTILLGVLTVTVLALLAWDNWPVEPTEMQATEIVVVVEPTTTTSTTTTEPPSTTTTLKAAVGTPTAAQWDQLAQCECGGNWGCNTGNGYSGGLQFDHTVAWVPFGGLEFAQAAWQATREQQIVVAERIWQAVGWRAWPGCTSQFGWM